jgi:GNAT superfamily N-acetyltransferase
VSPEPRAAGLQAIARPARTEADLLAALAVRNAAYEPDLPPLAYQARRMAWRKPARAAPWVLDRGDGEIVATLLCHRLSFSIDGRVAPGYGLGSVATAPAARRHGFASALCRAVIEGEERAARRVGLLFAGIAPAIYERLGFRTLPAWKQRCERLQELADSGPALPLAPLDPRRSLDRLVHLYGTAHAGVPHLARDAAGFLESIEDGGDDLFLALPEDGGYLRFSDDDTSLPILESVVLRPADELPALRTAARLALDLKRDALVGWLPPSPAVSAWFTSLSREKTLPMVRGAEPSDAWRIWSSDYF